MNVEPDVSVVLVQVPRGVDWKTPLSPNCVQAIELVESPGAPMSEETTATWMFGSPLGRFWRTVMNPGSWASILACNEVIDDELSTMNRMSRLPGSALAAAVREVVFSTLSGEQAARVAANSESSRAWDKRFMSASDRLIPDDPINS